MQVRLLVLGLLCAPPARAQSFNVDMGASTHPVPSATFRGAAGQPGVWNAMDETLAPAYSATMLDLQGQPTSVTVTLSTSFGTLGPAVYADPAGFTPEQAALYSDSLELSAPGPADFTLTISGLVPGPYEVFGYVGNRHYEGSFQITQCPGLRCTDFFYTQMFEEISVWRRSCCNASTGTMTLTIGSCGSPLSHAAINALQVVSLPYGCGSGIFCTGEAAGTQCACPCANCGLADRGCENSFGTGGGFLRTFGNADVSADTLVLQASHLPPATSVLFFQGTSTLGGGAGVTYGDGLRCAGGSVIRLATRFTSGGTAAFGAGQGSDPPISVAGAVPGNGGTRYYQAWYRNAPAYCTPSTFNLTNGFRVYWAP